MAQNAFFAAVFELILYLLVDIFFQFVCFHIGRLFIKAMTLGSSPKYPHDHETGLSIFGALLLLGPPFIYLLWIS